MGEQGCPQMPEHSRGGWLQGALPGGGIVVGGWERTGSSWRLAETRAEPCRGVEVRPVFGL